jgi:hypothetical protein
MSTSVKELAGLPELDRDKSEFDRFMILFDRLVAESALWLERIPSERLDWTPPSDSGIHFGSRLRHASVKTLFVHMAVAENFWIAKLKDCADGDLLPLPRDMNAFQAALDGDFLENSRKLHAENLANLKAFSPEQRDRRISFAGDGTEWTVMGFLWGLWGHRAYHLGNLDMLSRIMTGSALDFFSFNPKNMA